MPFPTTVSVEGEEQRCERRVLGPVVHSGLTGLTAAVEDQPILEGLQTGAETHLLRCGPTYRAIGPGQEFIPNVPKAANGLDKPMAASNHARPGSFHPISTRSCQSSRPPPRRVGVVPVQLVDPVNVAAPEHFTALERLPGAPNNARFRRGATELHASIRPPTEDPPSRGKLQRARRKRRHRRCRDRGRWRTSRHDRRCGQHGGCGGAGSGRNLGGLLRGGGGHRSVGS